MNQPTDHGSQKPDELSLAKDFRNNSREMLMFAMRRGCELADEFTRLEVQIAALLFPVAGIFLAYFTAASLDTSVTATLMRLGFAFALFFLIASLVMGLLHIKRKEKFWDEAHVASVSRFDHWTAMLKNGGSFKETYEFHSGVGLGAYGVKTSPVWTWILQTIFLAIAIGLFFVLAMVFLFGHFTNQHAALIERSLGL